MTMPTLTMQRAHDEAMGGDEPTLPPKPRRRSFSAEYKLAILEEYDACEGDGDKGALLRREGLYSSHIVEWRRARDAAAVEGLSPRVRQPKTSAEAAALAKANRRIERAWRPTWPSTSSPWTSREKRTRSWRCLPRARRPSRSRSRDRRLRRRPGAVDRHRAGVPGGREVQGHPLPAPAPGAAGRAASVPTCAGERPERL